MPLSVSFDGTNITQAESGDSASWADRGGGTGAAQDNDNQLEGSECRGRKVSGTTLGFAFQSTSLDLSASGWHVGIWLYVGTRGAVDTKANGGMRVRLGGGADPDTAPWYEWNVHGDDTIPATNKWMRVWLDVDRGSPDASSGTYNPNDSESFGGNFTCASITGNFRNTFIDRIDRLQGGGLTATGGDSVGGVFEDFLSYDVDTSTNRMGVVERIQGGLQVNARLTIGTSSLVVLDDSDISIIFQDDLFCESTFMGLTFDLQNANTDIDMANIVVASAGSTNLGDFIVSGSSGTFNCSSMNLQNLRIVTLTSVCVMTNSIFNACGTVTAPGSNLSGSSILAPTVANDKGAVVYNSATDPDTKMDGVTFVKGVESHHAIEFGTSVTSDITLRNCEFTNFGSADDVPASTFLFLATSGSLTLSLVGCTVGGGAASTSNIGIDDAAGISVTLSIDPVTTLINVKDNDGVNLQNARVYLQAEDGTGDLPYQASVASITRSGTTATVTQNAHGMNSNEFIKLEGITDKTEDNNGAHQITVSGANTYTYTTTDSGSTSYTGTIKATGATLDGLTDASGNISSSRSYALDQPVRGFVRKSSTSPRFKTFSLAGNTVDNTNGLTLNIRMVLDE